MTAVVQAKPSFSDRQLMILHADDGPKRGWLTKRGQVWKTWYVLPHCITTDYRHLYCSVVYTTTLDCIVLRSVLSVGVWIWSDSFDSFDGLFLTAQETSVLRIAIRLSLVFHITGRSESNRHARIIRRSCDYRSSVENERACKLFGSEHTGSYAVGIRR